MSPAPSNESRTVEPTLALSIVQPWASLIMAGAKEIETRSWSTRLRGPVGIHASKGFPRWAIEMCHQEPFRSALVAAGFRNAGQIPRGALIGQATLTECFRFDEDTPSVLGADEAAFGDFTPGRWGFRLANPVLLAEPERLGGSLSFWSIAAAREKRSAAAMLPESTLSAEGFGFVHA